MLHPILTWRIVAPEPKPDPKQTPKLAPRPPRVRKVRRPRKARPVLYALGQGVSRLNRSWGSALGFSLGFWLALLLLLPAVSRH